MEQQLEIISLYEEHEVSLSCLFTLFSELYPGLRTFWTELSRQEAQHADFFHKLHGDVRAGKVSFPETRFDVETLRVSAKSITAQLRAAERTRPQLPAAFELAITLEEMLLESQMFKIAKEDSPRMQHVFQRLLDETFLISEKIQAQSATNQQLQSIVRGGKPLRK